MTKITGSDSEAARLNRSNSVDQIRKSDLGERVRPPIPAKCSRNTDADRNSECTTTSSTDKLVVSKSFCAPRTRAAAIHWAGVVPTRSTNRRLRGLVLTAARRATTGSESSLVNTVERLDAKMEIPAFTTERRPACDCGIAGSHASICARATLIAGGLVIACPGGRRGWGVSGDPGPNVSQR
jgi:hypothetical protein